MKKVEILAPAGSYESLIAAVNAGADAVYIGGAKFGARAYADNPNEDMLIKALEYAHRFGVKVYMTVNTLLKEDEISSLYEYILPYYKAGIDAVIVQDLGVLNIIREHFKNLEIHASTQMSITGAESAIQLRNMGVARVVPAREISLSEIKEIKQRADIEVECFVHGALCYAYSGQCLMSSMIGGRSGNRGRCAQTCRLPYDLYKPEGSLNSPVNNKSERYLLSCKDLSSLDLVPDLIEAGIDSFKIEGRMKSPRYTAGVVSIWRKYVDRYYNTGRKAYKVEAQDRRFLLDLFDRGGQTEGYYFKHNGKDMLTLSKKDENKRTNEDYFKYLDNKYVNSIKKLKLSAEFYAKKGEPLRLFIESKENDIRESIYNIEPQEAVNRQTDIADVKKQLLKTGNTFYEFEYIDIDMDPGLFIPIKSINEIRREGLEKIDRLLLSKYYRDISSDTNNELISSDKNKDREKSFGINIICENKAQLDAVFELDAVLSGNIAEISFDADIIEPTLWKELSFNIKERGIRANMHMPHIFRTEAKSFFKKYEKELLEAELDGIIIRSMEELPYLNNLYDKYNSYKRPQYIFDYTLYNYNSFAKEANYNLGAARLTAPLEMNISELRRLDISDMEIFVYGRVPMMVSAQCLKKSTTGCDRKSETLILKDRQKMDMPVKNRCVFCYNTIYNASPISTIGLSDNIKRLSPAVYRLYFTTEMKKEVKKILETYIRCFILGEKQDEPIQMYTRGHLKRGIE